MFTKYIESSGKEAIDQKSIVNRDDQNLNIRDQVYRIF